MVIATRHHEHADQVVRAAEAGKHVFVEKPLAISWDELERVASTYERTRRAAAADGRVQSAIFAGAAGAEASGSTRAARRW